MPVTCFFVNLTQTEIILRCSLTGDKDYFQPIGRISPSLFHDIITGKTGGYHEESGKSEEICCSHRKTP